MLRQEVITVMLMVGLCGPAFGAQCTGNEGTLANPEWSVTWTKNGPSTLNKKERWSVRQTLGTAQTMTADLNLTRTDDTLAASKFNVTDKNDCNYNGDIKGSSVSGTYTCVNGGPYKFVLTCDWQ